MKLDSALAGLGFSGSQFGLVGFGHDRGGQASTIPVGPGGQLMGSAANLRDSFTSLISRGSREDGYAGRLGFKRKAQNCTRMDDSVFIWQNFSKVSFMVFVVLLSLK